MPRSFVVLVGVLLRQIRLVFPSGKIVLHLNNQAYMFLLLAAAFQVIHQSTQPIDCPEKKWATAGVPYDEPGGPPRRYLVLSNGPEIIADWSMPDTVDHVNLYWGKIPFDGQDLRLRIYMDHLIDPKSKLDSLDIRFCMGIRDGDGSQISVARCVSTFAVTPENEPRQYIDPGQKLPLAHLSQKWQTTLPSGSTVLVPNDTDPGDVAGIGMTLKQHPNNLQYGNLIAELDLHADHALKGRSLIVRTVARKPGGSLGTSHDPSCALPGAGERGWWPQADVYVRSDPHDPILIDPSAQQPLTAYMRIGDNGGVDWAMFNKYDNQKRPVMNNADDIYGTKNSGLWGVNVLYRVYLRGNVDSTAAVKLSIACALKDWPVAHVLSGPFFETDTPWTNYATGKLNVTAPGYLNRRSATDYDVVELGKISNLGDKATFVEYFVDTAGSSMLPTYLIFQPQKK